MSDSTLLPGKVVELEGTVYYIHGLVHGNPYIRISQEFRDTVNELLRGLSVICEDGASEWIANSVSFNEAEYFKLYETEFFKQAQKRYQNYKPELKIGSELLKMVIGMKSVKDLETIRGILFRTYLPEPEGMNSIMARFNRGSLENPSGEIPLRIKRYAYEARRSLEYARENNLNELHIVVGCAHELPLEYILRNKDVLNRLKIN